MPKDKNIRQNLKRQRRNKAVKQSIKQDIRSIRKSCTANKTDEAAKTLAPLMKKLDKAAGKGILSRNTAARKKSRLAKRVNALKPAG